jgi:hypothetical protein
MATFLQVATVVGLLVNVLMGGGVLAVVWRGGNLVGIVNTTLSRFGADVERLTGEIGALRETRDKHIEILGRIVGQLDSLELRVSHIEARA